MTQPECEYNFLHIPSSTVLCCWATLFYVTLSESSFVQGSICARFGGFLCAPGLPRLTYIRLALKLVFVSVVDNKCFYEPIYPSWLKNGYETVMNHQDCLSWTLQKPSITFPCSICFIVWNEIWWMNLWKLSKRHFVSCHTHQRVRAHHYTAWQFVNSYVCKMSVWKYKPFEWLNNSEARFYIWSSSDTWHIVWRFTATLQT